jgi:hypothetical protein
MSIENEDFETKYRLLALKKACIVMNELADSFENETTKSETKSLAWSISWAVTEIARLNLSISGLAVALARIAEGSVMKSRQKEWTHLETVVEYQKLAAVALAKYTDTKITYERPEVPDNAKKEAKDA